MGELRHTLASAPQASLVRIATPTSMTALTAHAVTDPNASTESLDINAYAIQDSVECIARSTLTIALTHLVKTVAFVSTKLTDTHAHAIKDSSQERIAKSKSLKK